MRPRKSSGLVIICASKFSFKSDSFPVVAWPHLPTPAPAIYACILWVSATTWLWGVDRRPLVGFADHLSAPCRPKHFFLWLIEESCPNFIVLITSSIFAGFRPLERSCGRTLSTTHPLPLRDCTFVVRFSFWGHLLRLPLPPRLSLSKSWEVMSPNSEISSQLNSEWSVLKRKPIVWPSLFFSFHSRQFAVNTLEVHSNIRRPPNFSFF